MNSFYKHVSYVCFVAAALITGVAQAQSYLSPGYIIGEIRDGLGFVQPQPAPDFVVRGRPEPSTLEYTALKPPPRGFHSPENKPSSKLEGQAKAIAELEAARATAQARASGAPAQSAEKKSAPTEEDPVPMKWNAWDTE